MPIRSYRDQTYSLLEAEMALEALGATVGEQGGLLFPLPTETDYEDPVMCEPREFKRRIKAQHLEAGRQEERNSLLVKAILDAGSYKDDPAAYALAHRELVKLAKDEKCYYDEFFRLQEAALGPLTPPHCDPVVNHAPGICAYCDGNFEPTHYQGEPKRDVLKDAMAVRQFRADYGVSHTGTQEPGKLRCPSEFRRALDVIHRWGGNRPQAEP